MRQDGSVHAAASYLSTDMDSVCTGDRHPRVRATRAATHRWRHETCGVPIAKRQHLMRPGHRRASLRPLWVTPLASRFALTRTVDRSSGIVGDPSSTADERSVEERTFSCQVEQAWLVRFATDLKQSDGTFGIATLSVVRCQPVVVVVERAA